MNLRIILVSLIPLLISVGLWIKDGARIAFWLTSVEERKEILIVEGMPELGTQTQIVWKDQFISGVETPLVGVLLATFLYFILHIRFKHKLGKTPKT